MNASELAARLGAKRSARSFRCACPACAYLDAFSIREARDGSALVRCMNGCTREDVDATLARVAGGDWTPGPIAVPADLAEQRDKRRTASLRLWAGSTTALGTLAEIYLASRGLRDLAGSPAIGFRGDATHPEGGRYPAMVALVVDAAGQPLAVHRTYVAPGGNGKANVAPAKASLGPVWGGAIRLHDHDPARALVIGEGIETAASAGVLTGLPAWAAVSAGNLAKGLQLPPAVRHVVIAVDPDPPGQAAAAAASDRWQREGRRVQLARPQGGGDFNDLLRAGGHLA